MEEKKHAKRNRNIILVAVIIIVVALVLRTWYYRDYYLFKGLIQSDRFDAIIAEQILENPKFWTDEDGELKNILEGTKFKSMRLDLRMLCLKVQKSNSYY